MTDTLPPVRIDLHTHSTVSDGTESPAEVIRAAKAAGLDVVALTDHDTTEGWTESARTAEEVGITLVRGIEVSTKHLGRGAHLFGKPDHDSKMFFSEFGEMPLTGFFCNGEIGPVGGATHIHGFTSCFGIFRPKNGK